MPKGRVNLQSRSLGFFAFETEEPGFPALPTRQCWPFPSCHSQDGPSLGGGQGRRRHDTDVAVFGFFPVLGHTVAWEHPGAAKGALPCPPAQLQPEVMLESFRELGSSLMLKAWEA